MSSSFPLRFPEMKYFYLSLDYAVNFYLQARKMHDRSDMTKGCQCGQWKFSFWIGMAQPHVEELWEEDFVPLAPDPSC